MKKFIALFASILIMLPAPVLAQDPTETVIPTETIVPTPTVAPTETQDVTPPVISNLGVGSITETSAKITWKTDELTVGYLDYGLSPSYGQSVGGNNYITAHEVTLSNLKPGTTYNFQVHAKDSSENEIESPNQSFKTKAKSADPSVEGTSTGTADSNESTGTLLPPKNLIFKVEQDGDKFSVILNWDKTVSTDIDGYKIYRGDGDRYPVELIESVDAETPTFTDKQVQKDVKYFYIVRSYKGEEESVDSEVSVVQVGEENQVSLLPKIVNGEQDNFWLNLAGLNLISGGILALGYLLGKFGEKILLKRKLPKVIEPIKSETIS